MEETPQRIMSGRFSRLIRNIKPKQWIWGLTWVIVAFGMALIPFTVTRLLAVVFATIGIWGAWPYAWGPLYTYLPDFNETAAIRRRNGRVARSARPGSRSGVTQKAPIDVQIASFPTSESTRGNLGTFYSPATNTDTSITYMEAWSGANLEPYARLTAEDGFANAILDVANMTSDSMGLILGLHKGPINPWISRNWAAASFHPKVINAGRNDFEERPPVNVYERQAYDFSDTDLRRRLFHRNTMAFVGLNVERPDNFKKIREGVRSGEISAKQFERLVPVTRMVKRLEQNLHAQGVMGVRTLDEMGIRTFAQSSWNIDIEQWYNLLQDPSTAPTVTDRRSVLNKDPLWPWPLTEPLALRDEAGKPYLILGGTYHRIARASRMNETIFPGEMKPLFNSGDIGLANETSLTVTMSGDTFPISKEAKALNYAIVIQEAFSGMFLSDEAYRSKDELQRAQTLRDRQDQLHYSGKQGMNYNLWNTWAAPDLGTLIDVDAIVEEHARSCEISLQYINWESRMMRAKFTASIGSPLL